jgi:MFS family permease
MMATTNIGALYAGRFLIGLANGYFMTFSQLYIQESSPAKYRGLFLAIFQFCTSMVRPPPPLLLGSNSLC